MHNYYNLIEIVRDVLKIIAISYLGIMFRASIFGTRMFIH
jgi:hypothetical protein